MIEVLKTSLKYQDTCPVCSTNWKDLADSLHSPLGDPNRFIALLRLENCYVCKIRFSKEVKNGYS